MSRIDHNRPVLRLIDDIRRYKQSPDAGIKLPKGVARELKQAETRPLHVKQLIHQCAIKVLEHVAKHRETSLVGRLVNEMPDEKTKDALLDWFCAFAPVTRSDDILGLKFDRTKEVRLAAAVRKPYWRLLPTRARGSFSLYDEIEKLHKRARARLRANTALDTIPIELMKGLENLLRDHAPPDKPRNGEARK